MSRAIEQDQPLSKDNPKTVEGAVLDALSEIERLLRAAAGDDNAEVILVPDTNALYAAPVLEQWAFDEFERFKLVLVPAVISEIDRHKDGHPNQAVRDKAKSLIRQIGEYRRRGRLVDGVPIRTGRSQIMAIAIEPDMSRTLGWLRPDSPDDRLMASTIEIGRRYLSSPVALVTRDLNLQNKCELAQMSFVLPPATIED
jgi:predicted ribonuclease YlaK